LKIIRGIKKWGGNADTSGTSHEWRIEVDLQDDLHREIREGSEPQDILLAIQFVDQLLYGYVVKDLRAGDRIEGPYNGEGATYSEDNSILRT
jgi:hypothetical protein